MSAPLLSAMAAAWRIAFLSVSAPVIGAALLMAIGRVTGARWAGLKPVAAFTCWLVPGAAVLGLCQAVTPLPAHLHVWMAWWAVLLRAVLATAGLTFAAVRLRSGASVTFAALTLTIYAVVLTPLATDWLLGQAPAHPVSAIGMMHLTQSIAAACAVMLMLREGSPAFRNDMAKLMIAAALGLAYLTYMDYLIVWFGNLPAHVGFYLARTATPPLLTVWASLLIGVAAPILLLWLLPPERGQRLAGGCVLAGLFGFDVWWIGAGAIAAIGALALYACTLFATRHLQRSRR